MTIHDFTVCIMPETDCLAVSVCWLSLPAHKQASYSRLLTGKKKEKDKDRKDKKDKFPFRVKQKKKKKKKKKSKQQHSKREPIGLSAPPSPVHVGGTLSFMPPK